MRQFNWIVILTTLLPCAAMNGNSLASEIKYTVQGIGSGTFDATPFTNQPFTFSVFAHTENVQTFSFYHAVNNDSMTIQVGAMAGTGTAGSSYLFSQPGSTASFAFVQLPVGTDWDSAQLYAYSAALNAYDLKSEIGPFNVPNPSNQPPTSLYLLWNNGGLSMPTTSQVTFQATFVPEPSTAALLVIGCGVALLARRR
jgi:hypothetical protein